MKRKINKLSLDYVFDGGDKLRGSAVLTSNIIGPSVRCAAGMLD